MFVTQGKITAFWIFDNITYELQPSSSYRDIYAPVFRSNKKLINELGQFYSTRVVVFFQVDYRFYWPEGSWYDEILNVLYVPVNARSYGRDGFIPTKWIQDVFIQTAPGAIYYQTDKMNPALLKAMIEATEKKITFHKGKENQPDGGNIKYFDFDKKNRITLTGIKSNNSGRYPSDLGLPDTNMGAGGTETIIHLWQKGMDEFERQTFHLDMYLQIAGSETDAFFAIPTYRTEGSKKKKTKQIVVFKGTPFVAPGQEVKNETPLEKVIDKAVKKLAKELNNFKISILAIPLPIMLFHDTGATKKGYYGMSYVNCIVENNLSQEGVRFITVYFPDFTEELIEIVRRENLPPFSFLEDIPPNIQVLLNAEAAFLGEVLTDKEQFMKDMYNNYQVDRIRATVLFMRKMHNHIMKEFAGYEQIRVQFVRNNFANYAEHYGGLHCLVKSIYG